MMKIKDLLRTTERDEVLKKLFEINPGQREFYENYCSVWSELEDTEPEVASENNANIKSCLISIEIDEDDKDEYWFVVNGTRENSDETFGLDFVPWAEWLEMEIVLSNKIKENNICLTNELILGIILDEMTIAGWSSKEVEQNLSEISSFVEIAHNKFGSSIEFVEETDLTNNKEEDK